MFLVKCKCGCFFTVKKESVGEYAFQCQNCKEKIYFTDISTILESSKALEEAGITISAVPDTAKVTVTFEA